jgi:dTDP-4-dehydrorhamnose reductase
VRRVAITGATGQLGRALVAAFTPDWEVVPLARPAGDVRELRIAAAIAESRPDLVINAAAMTDVDGCARDPDAAYAANALGPRYVALGCRRAGAALLQISTNEVFDGSREVPYTEFDAPRAINAYGASKLAGEGEVRALLDRHYIVRTAWLFGHRGNNFVEKMLRLGATGNPLRVVADEIGSPTYCNDLAEALKRLVTSDIYGTYHLVNSGACSRYEFARRIFAEAGLPVPVTPISAREFSRASQPPPYSALRSLCTAPLSIALRPWQDALTAYLSSRTNAE